MSTRRISSLSVRATARQVDAHENGTARSLGFVSLSVAMASPFFILDTVYVATPYAALLIVAIILLINLLLFQPWQTAINVDLDTASCRVDVRFMGCVPIHRRTIALDGRRFTVETRHRAAEKSPDTGLGCLMLALPFPLSLAWAIFGKGHDRGPEDWPVLCLRGIESGDTEDLVALRDHSVAEPLLEELRELFPGQVDQVTSPPR